MIKEGHGLTGTALTPHSGSTSIVPYIAAWSREVELDPVLRIDPEAGFTYEDFVPGDRDAYGALWRRQAIVSGDRGVAQLAKVNSRRQRRCMTRMLCQVCAGPPSRTSEGTLFLNEDQRTDWEDWPENLCMAHPPLCLPCAGESVDRCRYLLGSNVAVRVQDPQPWGVYGRQYALGPDNRLSGGKAVTLPYGDPGLGWTLAAQMVVCLVGCTIVDLADELARYGSSA
ncbi:hypothetical protein [Streptacidiphilus cavernicola]|uniref:Uncharacterized protein n=1 Tax=Streptacidiphilus cavernicola TaxID=3342716 RepID=A0ABV6VYI4_9ACTN